MQLRIRFDYGQLVPWMRRDEGALVATAGPDSCWLRTPVETRGEDLATVADFVVEKGERVPFVLTWEESHRAAPEAVDAEQVLRDTLDYWSGWVSRCTYDGRWRDAVVRSLITLKALTYARPVGSSPRRPRRCRRSSARFETGTTDSAGFEMRR